VSPLEKRTVETLGGYSLGISRNSAHRAEAIQFVQFLVRKQEQFMASTKPQRPGQKVEHFEVPLGMKNIYPWWRKPGDSAGSQRFASVNGRRPKYDAVSKAFSRALHSVLSRQSTAQAAVAALGLYT